MRARASVGLGLLWLPFMLLGCSDSSGEGQECAPGDEVACDCDNGDQGVQSCSSDGSHYGSCVCGEPGAGGAGDGSYMSTCQVNEDCDSMICHPFNAKGPHCTVACTSDDGCELPSPGCNNKGVCKAP